MGDERHARHDAAEDVRRWSRQLQADERRRVIAEGYRRIAYVGKILLRRWPDIDAVMCVSDPCAFGVMTEAHALGIAVPDWLAVAGSGDFEVSRVCLPALTTVFIDAAEIGSRAGELVVGLDPRTGKSTEPDRIRVDPRGSTARKGSR